MTDLYEFRVAHHSKDPNREPPRLSVPVLEAEAREAVAALYVVTLGYDPTVADAMGAEVQATADEWNWLIPITDGVIDPEMLGVTYVPTGEPNHSWTFDSTASR